MQAEPALVRKLFVEIYAGLRLFPLAVWDYTREQPKSQKPKPARLIKD
jgi:hypothetical protein